MYCLSWFQNWMLRRIIKKLVVERNQYLLFDLIYDTNAKVFYEDNHHTQIANMREQIDVCHEYQLMKLSRKS